MPAEQRPTRILFVTGHFAEPGLTRVLTNMAAAGASFDWSVHNLRVKVAALMTPSIMRKRLPRDACGADRVLLPGRFVGDVQSLSAEFGVPFELGPPDFHDLPGFFGLKGQRTSLSKHSARIFAELSQAWQMGVEAIVDRALQLREEGADVIDLGWPSEVPFPELEAAIEALHDRGLQVSVDAGDPGALARAGRAGADYVLSLTEETMSVLDSISSTPVLLPSRPGSLDSLERAAAETSRRRRQYILDPILEPFPWGFTASLLRYAELRRRFPAQRMMLGLVNVMPTFGADTAGLMAVFFAIVSDLDITDVLLLRNQTHCRNVIVEADLARRLMAATREVERFPIDVHDGLMILRDRYPLTWTVEGIADLIARVSDENMRIVVAEDGIHAYNNSFHWVGTDSTALLEALPRNLTSSHAFYLGAEAARAEVAWQLGKRYVQDGPLRWGRGRRD